jgi:phosphoribosylformylglycinamidine synthase
MLVIVKPQHEDDVRALFEHWELHCATIGVVTDDGIVRIRDGASEVAAVHAKLLTDAPTYVREGQKPRWLDAVQQFDFRTLSDLPVDMSSRWEDELPKSNGATDHRHVRWAARAREDILDVLASPEIASKRIVWRQYDQQVGTDTVVGPGSDAAVVRIKGTNKALAIATDGNAAYTHLDPYTGGAIAVCEAARNVACTGARPLAMTNCLNFGNPEKPEVYWQLSECIRGMADAAKALSIPVISGNVSLYNETNGEPIWPTPVVGVVGLIEDVDRVVPMGFQDEGDEVLILEAGGAPALGRLAGSEFVRLRHGLLAGTPSVQLSMEAALQQFLIEAAAQGILKSAHDISAGGSAIALVESSLAQGVVGQLFDDDYKSQSGMFIEGGARVVVSCTRDDIDGLIALAKRYHVRATHRGEAGGVRVMGKGTVDRDIVAWFSGKAELSELREAYESGLPRALGAAALNV